MARDLITCLQMMFGITNQTVSNRYQSLKNFYNNEDSEISQCCIEFSTNKDNYRLTRVFCGNESIETKLQSENSNYVYHGSEAISKIAKMMRPIFVPNGYHKMDLRVYETNCDQTNIMISELINHWSKSSGIDVLKTHSKNRKIPYYKWRYPKWRKQDATEESSSIVNLFSVLARATLRARVFGSCPSVICFVDVNALDKSEIKSLINLVSNVCREERLDILLITSKHEDIISEFAQNLIPLES